MRFVMCLVASLLLPSTACVAFADKPEPPEDVGVVSQPWIPLDPSMDGGISEDGALNAMDGSQ